jgi:branched-chain amino acid transport system substrate-binding protein
MSGSTAIVGKAESAGAKAAAAVLNAQGGILGHKVTVAVMDDAGAGTTAVSVAQQVMSKGVPYNLLLPGSFGADAIPMAAVFAKTPVLQITQASEPQLNDPSKYPNLYVPTGGYPPQETALVQRLKSQGITKLAIVTGDDVSGHEEAAARVAAAKKAGVSVVAQEFVPDTAVDATPQVQKALAAHPQALSIAGFVPPIPAIISAVYKLAPSMKIYEDPFASAFPLSAATTPAQRKLLVTENFPFLVKGTPEEKSAVWQTFLKNDKVYDPAPPLNLSADEVAYDSVMMAAAAAKKAGTISGGAVPTALGHIYDATSVPGFAGGKHLYTPTNHDWAIEPSDYGFAPGGKFVGGLLVPGT